MKKTLLLTFVSFFMYAVSYAQFEDLKALYVDGKYDKLVEKAEKATQKEKTMNEPLPYLYMAKGLFKISQDERFKNMDQYKNSEVDAINKFIAYKKKDKGNIYKDIADPFLTEVKTQVYEEARNFYGVKNYKKAASLIKKIIKIEPDNIGCLLLQGLCEYGVKNKTEGKKLVESAVKNIKNIQSIEDMSKEDQDMMKFGLMEYTNFLIELKDFTGAKSAITLGFQYFKGDEHKDYEDLYNKIVNG